MSSYDPDTVVYNGGIERKGRIINDAKHVSGHRAGMEFVFSVREKRGSTLYCLDHGDEDDIDSESLSSGMLARALSTPENASAMSFKRERFTDSR